ncbi:MAG TPA: hypothetical protein VE631_09425 [Alphaproteobacteria bacterium]|nr:hypothetical protein [Alphaproteobacteria bacterium]
MSRLKDTRGRSRHHLATMRAVTMCAARAAGITRFAKGMTTMHDESGTRPVDREGGWPPPNDSLAALVDLSMTDDDIARYFHIDAASVRSRRQELGLG